MQSAEGSLNPIMKKYEARRPDGNTREAPAGIEGRTLETALDDTWAIYLTIRKDALDWLRPKHRNNGTFLTARGRLYPVANAESDSDLPTLSVDEMEARYLALIARLLSYANGAGWT